MDKRCDPGAVGDSRLQEPTHHVTEEDHSSIVQMRVILGRQIVCCRILRTNLVQVISRRFIQINVFTVRRLCRRDGCSHNIRERWDHMA